MNRMPTLGLATLLAAAALGTSASGEGATKITYVVGTPNFNVGYPFATLPVALGYFEDEALDVTVEPGQSSALALQLLTSGTAQIAVAQPTTGMSGRANGTTMVKGVYPIARRNANDLLVRCDSEVKTFRDMAGRKLGVATLGSGANAYTMARAAEEGIDPNSIELVNVGVGAPAAEALKSGVVDAYTTVTVFTAQLENAGYEFCLLPPSRSKDQMYGFMMFATDDYIAAHPDVIARVGRATAKATVFAQTNPEAAVRIFWSQYPEQAPKDPNDAKALADAVNILTAQLADMKADVLPADFAWGSQEASAWATMQDFLLTVGQIAAPLDVGVYFDDSQASAYVDFDPAEIERQAREWKP